MQGYSESLACSQNLVLIAVFSKSVPKSMVCKLFFRVAGMPYRFNGRMPSLRSKGIRFKPYLC